MENFYFQNVQRNAKQICDHLKEDYEVRILQIVAAYAFLLHLGIPVAGRNSMLSNC